MGSQNAVLRALADLNRAALGQESWDTGLKGLSNALRVEATSFEEYSADGRARAFGYTSFDDAMARDYLAHYHRVNPRLDCVLATKPGDPLIDDFMVPSRSRGRSEFFDWYDKTSEFTYCMAVKLHKCPESWAAMAFHRPTPNVPFEPGTRELLQCIAPNLILIYQTTREIEALRADEKARSLDSFRTALAFLTGGGRIDAANAAFAELLARTSALRVDKAGRIVVRPADGRVCTKPGAGRLGEGGHASRRLRRPHVSSFSAPVFVNRRGRTADYPGTAAGARRLCEARNCERATAVVRPH
jgi:hypothetical protein